MWETEYPKEALAHGINKLEYYNSKFGADRIPPMMQRLSGVFAAAGIAPLSMGGNTGPTIDAHRLAAHAEKHGRGNEFMEQIMQRYFCEEQAPCDVAVLAAAAEAAGVPDASSVLADPNREREEVEEQVRVFARGVSGVPFFIVSDGKKKVKLSGAQPPEAFTEIFESFIDEV